MAQIDWNYWRHKYVSGEDSLTLKALSDIQGSPAYITIRKRSAAEDWDEQRKRFRNSRDTQAIHSEQGEQATARVEKIIDTAEMLTRHMKAARMIGQKAILAMQATDPATLKPADALAWMKFAIEAERLTEGLATQRQEIDLSGMSDAELEKLANGG